MTCVKSLVLTAFAYVFYYIAVSGTSKCGIIDHLLFHMEDLAGKKPHC